MGPRCFFERARRSHIFRPELFCRRCGPTAPDGRLPIDANLKIKGMPVEFAAGDVAWLPIDGTHASVMSCQHARPMGRFAGYNVVGDLLSRPMLPPGNWPDNQRDIGTVDHQSLNLPIEGLRTPGGGGDRGRSHAADRRACFRPRFRLDPFLRALACARRFDLRTFALHPAAAVSDRGIFFTTASQFQVIRWRRPGCG
jgi:hypothetical protein